MQIDLQADYILVLWDSRPHWAGSIYGWCLHTHQPKAAQQAQGPNDLFLRPRNILSELQCKAKNHFRNIRDDISGVTHHHALDAIKVTGFQLKNFADIKLTHPDLGRIDGEEGVDTRETSLIMEVIADLFIPKNHVLNTFYGYIENECAGPFVDPFPLSCCFLLGRDTIFALSLFPLKAIQQIDALDIVPFISDRPGKDLDTLREQIKAADIQARLAAKPETDDVDRNDTPAGLTDTAQDLGGIAATAGPEKGERHRKPLTPEQQEEKHKKRLEKMGFKNITIEMGEAKTKIKYFEDEHIDIIEQQFQNFLEVAETKAGNEHFKRVTSKILSNKKQGARTTFTYKKVRYSIGIYRIEKDVQVWFKREPDKGREQADRSKYASFVYIE